MSNEIITQGGRETYFRPIWSRQELYCKFIDKILTRLDGLKLKALYRFSTTELQHFFSSGNNYFVLIKDANRTVILNIQKG